MNWIDLVKETLRDANPYAWKQIDEDLYPQFDAIVQQISAETEFYVTPGDNLYVNPGDDNKNQVSFEWFNDDGFVILHIRLDPQTAGFVYQCYACDDIEAGDANPLPSVHGFDEDWCDSLDAVINFMKPWVWVSQ